MVQNYRNWLMGALALGTVILAAPLAANVRDGVDAWSRGDYSAAVAHWEGPAAQGDPDAMFNLGQAYRLGRGVPLDHERAEQLYAAAAESGHLQAADTYGLMLFQDGRREQALPYVQAASRRGDPRARYLLGIAHFNGDLVPRDWQRAYALLTLANAEGLPQAANAIAQMDEHIPLEQRQQGAALAQELQAQADSARAVELAQADLGNQAVATTAMPVNRSAAASSPRVPQPIPTTAISPSVAAARAAVEDARSATGTESPANAGTSYGRTTRAQADAAPTQPLAPVQPVAQDQAGIEGRAPATHSQPQAVAASGPWRVQLGAFSVRANAERLWDRLSGRAELAGRERLLIPAGGVTKLQAGGYASRAQADTACQSLKGLGHDCIVTRD